MTAARTAAKTTDKAVARPTALTGDWSPDSARFAAPTHPANDDEASHEKPSSELDSNNQVRETVESICKIQREMHEIRDDLVAHGIPNQTISVMVEMGARNKLVAQEGMVEAALAASVSELGEAAISRESLMQQVGVMVDLEKDTGAAKALAKSQGMALPALNALIGLVRQNPGDGGTRMVRLFVGYALACNISLEGVGQLHKELAAPKASVLPVIERQPAPDKRELNRLLVREILVGLLIGLGVIWMVV